MLSFLFSLWKMLVQQLVFITARMLQSEVNYFKPSVAKFNSDLAMYAVIKIVLSDGCRN